MTAEHRTLLRAAIDRAVRMKYAASHGARWLGILEREIQREVRAEERLVRTDPRRPW